MMYADRRVRTRASDQYLGPDMVEIPVGNAFAKYGEHISGEDPIASVSLSDPTKRSTDSK